MTMKRLLAGLLVATAIAACGETTAPRLVIAPVDDTLVPEPLRVLYREDAARLALRDLQGAGNFDGIFIPDDVVETYYRALILVYNAESLPARDTVVQVYDIHTFRYPATRSLYMLVSGDQEWAQWLARDVVPTGNATVDGLLRDYALSLDGARTMSAGDFLIVLKSATALNMDALSLRFARLPGVRYAGPNGVAGDGNDIRGWRGAVVRLDYSVGYGDCPAGCIARRSYRFDVHDDGTVEFVGASGSPPPYPGQP